MESFREKSSSGLKMVVGGGCVEKSVESVCKVEVVSRKKSSCEPVKTTLQDFHLRFVFFFPPSDISSFLLRSPHFVILNFQVFPFDEKIFGKSLNLLPGEPGLSLELKLNIVDGRSVIGKSISITLALTKAKCSSCSFHGPFVPSYVYGFSRGM